MAEQTRLEKARKVVLDSFRHYVNAMYPYRAYPSYRDRFKREMNENAEEVDALIEAAREEAKHPTCASCVSLEADGTCGHHYFLLRTDLVGTVGCNDHEPKDASYEG